VLDVNTGEATVYAPMDVGLPADGIMSASGEKTGWTYAQIDVETLADTRVNAQVANDRDWSGQLMPTLRNANVEILG
jgi:hypothetical protein